MTVVKGDRVLFPDLTRDFPGLVSIERAELRCGCTVYLGKRLDDLELCSASIPCSDEHGALMVEFARRYEATMGDERLGPRPAVDVADQVLMEVAADML